MATYILTLLFFATIALLVFFFTKKNMGEKPDYLKIDELETTGWEIVDEIRAATEESEERLRKIQQEMDEKICLLEEYRSLEQKMNTLFHQSKELLEQTKQKEMKELIEEIVAYKISDAKQKSAMKHPEEVKMMHGKLAEVLTHTNQEKNQSNN